jgi:hypothetical protein
MSMSYRIRQAVAAHVDQLDTLGQMRFDQPSRGIGEQYLAAVTGSRDSGRTVNVDAHVVVATQHRFACVDSHPHGDGDAARPVGRP